MATLLNKLVLFLPPLLSLGLCIQFSCSNGFCWYLKPSF